MDYFGNENNYDTRLLHRNIAFPLLKKLTDAEDPLAKKVFRKEIIKRYKSGIKSVREFLENERYYEYLTVDERLHVWLDNNDFNALVELYLSFYNGKEGDYSLLDMMIDRGEIKIEDQKIIELDLGRFRIREFPKAILKLTFLEVLKVGRSHIKEIPKNIDKLSNLKELWLNSNQIENLPESIYNLKNLESFKVGGNKLERLSDNIGNLTKLKDLSLSHNSLKEIPYNIGELTNLIKLNLRSNCLKKLPDSICKLKNLEWLMSSNNLLEDIPESILDLKLLTYLDLEKNNFKTYPEILKKMSEQKENKINIVF